MTNIHTVTLPDIGEGVVEGEVIDWLKKEGDSVGKDEPVVVIMTDKATVELPAPVAGKIAQCFYPAGQIAKVGKPLYSISQETEEQVKQPETKQESVPLPDAPVVKKDVNTKQVHPVNTISPSGPKGSSLAIPSIRHLARDLGVDIESIQGTGKDGRITLEDLHSEESQTCSGIEKDIIEPIIGIRRLMMKKMTESKQTIPHFSYFERVDATRLINMRQKISEKAEAEGIHLTYMPMFIRALSLTIQKYSKINSTVDVEKSELHIHPFHHIGIAMTSSQGLIVPVIKNVEKMSLTEIIHHYEDLKQRGQSNSLKPEEMRDGTITISNFGVLGGDGIWATPIINIPESAILAIAKITPMPIAVNGQAVVKNMVNLSWSFDHRIIDGHLAALVSHYFAQLLNNPAALL